MNAWALIPARGGSKSIPLKNLAVVGGRPLLDYVSLAGRASGVFDRIICSTDNDTIAAHAQGLGIEVDERPGHLATDVAKVDDVAKDLLQRAAAAGLPDILVLLQPTSLFVQPGQIQELVRFFSLNSKARSVHNVSPVPHNLHMWNQRTLSEEGAVSFPFLAERSAARNKQEKPMVYAFGNLIAARCDAILAGDGFYAHPAYAIPISWDTSFDLDRSGDIPIAEALIASGLIDLKHLSI